MKSALKISAVIHLSATAVCTVVARQSACKSRAEIMAIGIGKTQSFCYGKIVHREQLLAAIKKSIKDAEEMANVRIETVSVCFGSPELISDNAGSVVALTEDRPIDGNDMARALSQVKDMFLPQDYYLAQFLPQMIWLDDAKESVKNAIGMTAVSKMAVAYHLIAMPVVSLNHIYHLLQDCQVMVHSVIFEMIAGAEYALMEEERERGVLFVDIGAKSTNLCVYIDQTLVLTDCIAMGGDDVTADIVNELLLTNKEAERLKHHYVNLNIQADDKKEFINIETQGEMGVVNRERLSQIALMRYNRLFDTIMASLEKRASGAFVSSGIVLSGGGSQAKGLVAYLKKRWKGMSVHMTNTNTRIAVDADRLSEQQMAELNTLVRQRRLQTALGAMLYDLNDDFHHQQAIHEYEQMPASWLDKLVKIKDRMIAGIKGFA